MQVPDWKHYLASLQGSVSMALRRIGDKTQLLALLLATQLPRALARRRRHLGGRRIAGDHALASAVGAWIVQFIGARRHALDPGHLPSR